MKNFFLLFFLALAIYSAAHAQEGKVNIAVNDFAGKGIDQSTASIISDRLRAELVNTGVFRVMERTEMESILKEQGFQKTGLCDEASCLVEIGQMLGVDRILAGTVGNVGRFWTISVRMINVATGEILFTVNEDYEGEIKDVISQITVKVASKLAAGVDKEVQKTLLSHKKGDLYIQSDQQGAKVEIDGALVEGVTPLMLKEFTAGEHRIVVRKGDWFGSQTVMLNPDDLLKVSIKMEQGKGSLKVFSTPTGAQVYVDGTLNSETPMKIEGMEAGEHELIFAKDGFVSEKQYVRIVTKMMNSVSITLQPSAILSVSVIPMAATIEVNGKVIGPGSINSYIVPAGKLTVLAKQTDFETYREEIELAPGESRKIKARLISSLGFIHIISNPAKASVLLNNNFVGFTPYLNKKLTPGNYMLALNLANYEPVKENIVIAKNEPINKIYTLHLSKEYLDSLAREQEHRHKKMQWIRRTIFGAIAVGSTGVGIYFNNKVQNGVDRQNQLQADYRAASTNFDLYQKAYEDEGRKYSQAKTMRNISYGIGILCAVGFSISIPF